MKYVDCSLKCATIGKIPYDELQYTSSNLRFKYFTAVHWYTGQAFKGICWKVLKRSYNILSFFFYLTKLSLLNGSKTFLQDLFR